MPCERRRISGVRPVRIKRGRGTFDVFSPIFVDHMISGTPPLNFDYLSCDTARVTSSADQVLTCTAARIKELHHGSAPRSVNINIHGYSTTQIHAHLLLTLLPTSMILHGIPIHDHLRASIPCYDGATKLKFESQDWGGGGGISW